jgi:effector-binding domain-containing protein
MEMVCAVPVQAGVKMPAKYKVMQTSGGAAIKGIYTGGYGSLTQAHNEINKFIEFKNLEITGAPWEVYIINPDQEPDSAKWVTEVYYPVKK